MVYFLLVESSPVRIGKVLGYVVLWFVSIVCLPVAVPSHHISEAGTRAIVLDNVFDNLGVVILFSRFIGFSYQIKLFRAGTFILIDRLIVTRSP